MRKFSTTIGIGAALAAGSVVGSANASSAVSVIGQFADPFDGRATVFEDTTFSFVNPSFLDGITAADIGQSTFAAFAIESVGLGLESPFLDSGNALAPGGSVSPSPISTQAADITVEGIITGTIVDVILGSGGGGTIVVGGAFAQVFFGDAFEFSSVGSLADTTASFTDLNPAATFSDDGIDDFFTLGFVNVGGVDFINEFALGLSVDQNFLFPGIDPGVLSPALGGAVVDLFANGSLPTSSLNQVGADGDSFAIGDANFSINVTPSPAAAGVGVLGLIGLLSRRKRETEEV